MLLDSELIYFIIRELYLGFPKYVVNVLKEAYSTITPKQHITSLPSYLFFENSSSKASGLLFIFVHVRAGHAYFPNDEIRIPCMSIRHGMLFSICRMPE